MFASAIAASRIGGRPGPETEPAIRDAAAWLRPAIPAPMTATEICSGMLHPSLTWTRGQRVLKRFKNQHDWPGAERQGVGGPVLKRFTVRGMKCSPEVTRWFS